jgi:hypothetical protein
MIWIKFSGNDIMEFCFRNIKPNNENYEFVNQNYLNKIRLKKIRKKSKSILDSLLLYFSENSNIELDDLYYYVSRDKIDFWKKIFIHCIILSETENYKEENYLDSEITTTKRISIFTEQIIEHSNFGNIELLKLKFEQIKSKIEFNLVFVEQIFKEKIL